MEILKHTQCKLTSPMYPSPSFNLYPHMLSQSGFIYILTHISYPSVLEFEENSKHPDWF